MSSKKEQTSPERKRKAEDAAEEGKEECKAPRTEQKAMTLNAYLYFDGNCREAVNFYKEVFNGEIGMMSTYGEAPCEDSPWTTEQKDLIMHASLSFHGVEMMFSDSPPDKKKHITGNNVHLSIFAPDLELNRRTFAALAEGGEITMPLEASFWGSMFGMVTDKFGVQWMFSSPLPAKN